MLVLNRAVLREEIVLLAVDNAELVEVESEVIPLVALESPLLVDDDSEDTVLSVLERAPLVELESEVIPLVALESPLLVELESEVIPLVALESKLFVLPIAVLRLPIELENWFT
jgi:hypothetical protein